MNPLQNLKDLPPQKKRVLAIGGVAFVVLLFVSFLLSLSEDEQPTQTQPVDQAQSAVTTPQDPRQPNDQRYDFEQGTQEQGTQEQGALEDLLKTPEQPQVTPSDPFAGMQGTGTESGSSENANAQDLDQVFVDPAPAPGPAPIPTNEPPQTILICDSFGDAGSAESKKAILAFQGMVSSVVQNDDGTYSLKLGPYESAERGRSVFNDLSSKGLLERCALITQ